MPSTMTFNFCNLPPEDSDLETARAVVIPMPYEGTVSYRPGTKDGPMAILMASRQVELYDDELDWSPYEAGIATVDEIIPSRHSYEAPIEQAYDAVKAVMDRGQFPFLLGGEHSITTGCIRAALEKYPDLHVLQIDAHADLREAYEETPFSHASVAKRLVDLGGRLTQIGIRNISAEEMAWWKANNQPTRIFWARDYHAGKWGPSDVLEGLGENVFVTIDVDGLDPSIMPATGTPEPGGLLWYQVLDILRPVFKARNVVGADILELAPIPGFVAPDFLCAKLIYKLIGYRFHGRL